MKIGTLKKQFLIKQITAELKIKNNYMLCDLRTFMVLVHFGKVFFKMRVMCKISKKNFHYYMNVQLL